MTTRVPIRAILPIVLAACTGSGQDAPPTIAQSGVVNFASRMPPRLAGGAIARGSLISIRGWRLGPAEPVRAAAPKLEPAVAGVRLRLRQGAVQMDLLPVMVSFGEIQALLPDDAPLGAVEVSVVRNGVPSRTPASIEIVQSSFGAFSQNGRGWGPGDARSADGGLNTPEHAARPGEIITLRGTGLGPSAGKASIEVRVGGRAGQVARVAHQAAGPGTDEISFAIPTDVPEGCYVPVRVLSGSRVSNTVTIAVNREGGACSTAASWMGTQASQSGTVAFLALVRVSLRLILTPREHADFVMDVGYASFERRKSDDQPNPYYVFPVPGTCATLAGPMTLSSLIRPESTLLRGTGTALDAGDVIRVIGSDAERTLPRSHGTVLGGTTPLPQAQSNRRPLFLQPGDFLFSVPGGRDVSAFDTSVRVSRPIEWTNRDRLATVERTQGFTVKWRAARRDGLVLITAVNSDEESGGVGMCSCIERAVKGSFYVPPDALANIPFTPAQAQGLPTNLLSLVELPGDNSGQSKNAHALDRVIAFYASALARTVSFR